MSGLWEAPLTTLQVVAAARPGLALDPVPEPDDVTPGWLGFLCVVALFAATILLWFSMRKQLRRIDFVEVEDPSDGPGDGSGDGWGDGSPDGSERATRSEAAPAATPSADPDVEPPAPERP